MIGIKINSPVVLAAAATNDKGTLVIELAETTAGVTEKKSVFDTMLTARTAAEGTNTKLLIFGPQVPKDKPEAPRTKEQKIALVSGDIIKLIKQLSQIAEQYMTTDKIDLESLDVQFANTGIVDQASLEAKVLDQDVLTKIYGNIVRRFIELVTPFINNPEYSLRFKLIRQSKDKHYPTIPSRYIGENPFVELMSVPAEQSRVKFSKWEIEQGLDNSAPVAQYSAEAKPTEKQIEDANPFAPQA